MIACFDNLIGIRKPCTEEQTPSDSGLYIQNLPEMTIKLADAIVTHQESGIEVLEDLYEIAVGYLANDVRTRMMPYFKMNSILENSVSGFYPYNRTQISPMNGFYKGIQLQVRQWPYLDIFLSELTLWVDQTGEIPVEIWNLTTGKLLDTITVNAIAGQQVTIPVYKNYSSNGQILNLFIGYNSTDITSYQSNIYQFLVPFGNCQTCYNTPNFRYGNKYIWTYSIAIAEGSDKIQTNAQPANDCGGLSVKYTLNCSLDKWVCATRRDYSFALLHRWGMEILRSVELSNRLNSVVMFKKEERETLYGFYEQEYQKAMNNCFRNLRLNNDICFYCNAHIMTGIAMP